MKLLKLLSKLGLKSNPKIKKPESQPQEDAAVQKDAKPKTKYPVSIFELIKKHGNEPEAQNVIIKRLQEMDEAARGYALDSLIDNFGEDPKTIKLLDKYLKLLIEEDKIQALKDFAIHHGDIEQIISLIDKYIPEISENDKYCLLSDLTDHHGKNVNVQKLIVKHIKHVSVLHQYDVLLRLYHSHGLDREFPEKLTPSDLKNLTETQIKRIFSLAPEVTEDLVGNHINSLSEKNRSILIKNASKDKEESMEKKKEKKVAKQQLNELEKEVILLDLSNLKKVKNALGEETLEVNFQNPVKIYPYVYEKNEDTQIGDAFLTVKGNKIYATITLCPQLREIVENMPDRKPIYKPSGNLSIHKGEAKRMMVDFIYMVF